MPVRRAVTLSFLCSLLVGSAIRVVAIDAIHAPWGDNGAAILDVAKNLANGKGYTTNRIWTFYGPPRQFGQPEGNRQPLLPLAEAAVRLVAGPSFRAAQFVPLIFGLIAIALCFRLGLHLGGSAGAALAAWFSATDPIQIYFSAQVEDQIVFLVFFLALLLWLATRHGDRLTGKPFVPALLLAALYLTRANGLLMVAAYGGICLLHRRLRHFGAVLGLFVILCSPWFVRNIMVFGNPLHTDNAYFLFTDHFEEVFSVRSAPPSLREYVTTHTIHEMVGRWLKGAYLSAEGFLLGNVFRDEPFARGSLMIPLLFAAYGLYQSRFRRLLEFTGIAFVLHFLSVSWHAHGTYRYYIPFYAFIMVGAGIGIERIWIRWCSPLSRSWKTAASAVGLVVLLFPLIRPLAHTLGRSDRKIHRDAMEVVSWLSTEAEPGTVVMDFPIIEKYVYLYDLPTVNTPLGSLADIWGVAEDYGATNLVVCADQLELIPSLNALWRSERGRIVERELPSFLKLELTTRNGGFKLYRFVWNEQSRISADSRRAD
jgi:hypothetical protein